jgi:hypothetical protein
MNDLQAMLGKMFDQIVDKESHVVREGDILKKLVSFLGETDPAIAYFEQHRTQLAWTEFFKMLRLFF